MSAVYGLTGRWGFGQIKKMGINSFSIPIPFAKNLSIPIPELKGIE